MKASIIISTYNRKELLEIHLNCLQKQEMIKECEILVFNDGLDNDGTKELCESHPLNIKYVFTGQRNLEDNMIWRVPGFVNNIGAKLAESDLLIFSCSEIYHLGNDTVKNIIEVENSMATPKSVLDDIDGKFLNSEMKEQDIINVRTNPVHPFVPNPLMPYFMGVPKKAFMDIGGYDEDFTGLGDDDNDLVSRLKNYGLQYKFINSEIVHLFHGVKRPANEILADERFIYNRKLWHDRKDIIIRNKDKDWGMIK